MTALLSAVQAAIASLPSSKVKCLGLRIRDPPASRSATYAVPWPDDSKNATRLPSAVALGPFIQSPAQFVSRLGFSMSLPVRGSTRFIQILQGASKFINTVSQGSE